MSDRRGSANLNAVNFHVDVNFNVDVDVDVDVRVIRVINSEGKSMGLLRGIGIGFLLIMVEVEMGRLRRDGVRVVDRGRRIG